jgi:hypothetical protein
MRVLTTTAAGPVGALPQDLVDREFSQIMWTNFSGQVTFLTRTLRRRLTGWARRCSVSAQPTASRSELAAIVRTT